MSMRRLLLFRLADGFGKIPGEVEWKMKETVKNFNVPDIVFISRGDNLVVGRRAKRSLSPRRILYRVFTFA